MATTPSVGSLMTRGGSPSKSIQVLRLIFALVPSVALLGCRDPGVTIWLRNDSAMQIVAAVADDSGGPTLWFLADPHATGLAFTSRGFFKGRITTIDPGTCKVIGEAHGEGGAFAVVVSGEGVPSVEPYGTAFPGHLPTRTIPPTTLCGATAAPSS